jgi:DNA-binding NarL/FixJ family response regulator
VLCGIAYIKELAHSKLSGLGFRVDPAISTKVVLDCPPGYGLGCLKESNKDHLQLIVVTWNSCPEYMDDLWDLDPNALLAGEIFEKQNLAETLSAILYRVRNGERYRLTPGPPTPLTRGERLVLHQVAQGLRNRHVAQHLYLQEQTVKNTLRSVYRKLGVSSHLEAALYYWGILQQIDPISMPLPSQYSARLQENSSRQ